MREQLAESRWNIPYDDCGEWDVVMLAVVLGVCACVVVAALTAALCVCGMEGGAAIERRLRRAEHERNEAVRVLNRHGTLVNNVAHELKNPVTAIVCAAETLEHLLDNQLDSEKRETLRHIRDHGTFILSLMRDFIDVTRGETGLLRSHPETISVREVVEGVMALLQPFALQRAVTLVGHHQAGAEWINVDPKHAKQILFNLVHNAIKYTARNSTVAVDTTAVQGDTQVAISVSDQGAGISRAEISTFFEPRYRMREPAEGIGGQLAVGSGLGLALVKSLVTLEGGELAVESEPGFGTRVTVRLERVAPPAVIGFAARVYPVQPLATRVEDGDRPVAARERPLSGSSVLVVQGDGEMRSAVSGLIESLGGVVDGVAKATEALEAIHRRNYTAVIVDDSVEGVLSYDVARLLRREMPDQPLKLVVATSQPGDKELLRAVGADRCLEKPFDSRALVESITGVDSL